MRGRGRRRFSLCFTGTTLPSKDSQTCTRASFSQVVFSLLVLFLASPQVTEQAYVWTIPRCQREAVSDVKEHITPVRLEAISRSRKNFTRRPDLRYRPGPSTTSHRTRERLKVGHEVICFFI